MPKSLRQCTYTGKSIASKPGASCSNQKLPEKQTEMVDMKAEILSLLKNYIPLLLMGKLKTVLMDKCNNKRSELHAVKTEVVGNIALLRSDLESMKKTVTDMDNGLSACSDYVTSLQESVSKLEMAVATL